MVFPKLFTAPSLDLLFCKMGMKTTTHLHTAHKSWQWPAPRPVSSQPKLLADLKNGLTLLTIQEMNETLQISTLKCRESHLPLGTFRPCGLSEGWQIAELLRWR